MKTALAADIIEIKLGNSRNWKESTKEYLHWFGAVDK
jgi:hypothetical protein